MSLNHVVGGRGNVWYYYHDNAHGDLVAVTDGQGNVCLQYVNDPYGNMISVKDGSGTIMEKRHNRLKGRRESYG
ncbi:Hypothetical protein DEACI_0486 [Acididesulfobacillus acetoxydans]|uniref:RHS repeat protein n=1 Tax=Acididesulfobacillus acetoxydans TaxID=1561005 RepID=A0A8S0VVN6_9FIRM|nr:hypothetical protein [Acididesulfobacillus acetoxydans]CAA7599853.1 Hypothetical protein DEACI_0486 [Acididesulfobacillus acetoxydans]CEJ07419.1 Hypothetical protein DEACI_1882 [Acididesulfobacillus acetoxydans]